MTLATFTVTDSDTALALGSGDVPVLGTPRLLAWIEQTTVAAVAPLLTPGTTTVGVQVELTHSRASRVGTRIQVEVTDLDVQERQIVLQVVAREQFEDGDAATAGAPEVGRARVVRARVDRDRFLAKALLGS